MAQTENGIGISYKLKDGTMVWARRDTWAELTEDVRLVFGEDALALLEEELHGAWKGLGGPKHAPQPAPSAPQPVTPATLDADSVAAAMPEGGLETCPRCGSLKDRPVPAGVSKKTGKPYPAFMGCSTPGCPGR